VILRVRAAFATALLALAGCGVDLQADRVCVTSVGYGLVSHRVPGVTSAPLPTFQLAFSVGAAIPGLTTSGANDVQVLFRSLALDSTQSAAFVTALTVKAVPPAGSSLAQLTLGTYQRPAAGAGATVTVTGSGADVYPYLTAGRLVLEISGSVDPSQAPNGTFTAAAEACAEVKGSVGYL
jgi:hypothetical protein